MSDKASNAPRRDQSFVTILMDNKDPIIGMGQVVSGINKKPKNSVIDFSRVTIYSCCSERKRKEDGNEQTFRTNVLKLIRLDHLSQIVLISNK